MSTKLKLHQLESLPDVLKIGTKKEIFFSGGGKSGVMWVLKLWTAVLSCVKKTTEEMNRKQNKESMRDSPCDTEAWIFVFPEVLSLMLLTS